MVLTIHTNEDNPAVIKILIAHNLTKSGEKIQIQIHNPHGNNS